MVAPPRKGAHRFHADPWLHTRNHAAMLALAVRQHDRRETLGQVARIHLAAPGWSSKTVAPRTYSLPC
jgi:hypothetical protein